jgi:stage V sporulation protein AC
MTCSFSEFVFTSILQNLQKGKRENKNILLFENKIAFFGENQKKNGGKPMQSFDKQAYAAWVKERAARSPWGKNCLWAFLVGGGICLLGQVLLRLYLSLGLGEREAGQTVTLSLIFLSALLTFLGVFDRIARHAGAGTLLPVTGFANAVVAPAMDNKSEGFITGVGAKTFTVAGPVLVYGTAAAVLYGVLYWAWGLLA